MTLPSVVKDWLILIASTNLAPVAPVLVYLSLPARSTKLSLPHLIWSSPVFGSV